MFRNKFAPFASEMIRWYQRNARDLPWRQTRDPYKIWISEIMLQQTTVNTVVPYYQRWVKELPDIPSVSQAPLSKILKLWQGLGYYQRARNIHQAAKIICRNYSRRIPSEATALRRLPGFGPYTTGAVLSIAFDQRQPIIDANVRRVVMRLKGISGLAIPQRDTKILKFLEVVMPLTRNDLFNQAMMELGALICRSHDPRCCQCPVSGFCCAYRQNRQAEIPQVKSRVLENITVAVALIRNGKKYFIQKRTAPGFLSGLWEFPGGKIEPGETPPQALRREVQEEIEGILLSAKPRMKIRHAYTRFRVTLAVWDCKLKAMPKLDRNHRWATLNGIRKLPLPSGTVKIIQKLKLSETL